MEKRYLIKFFGIVQSVGFRPYVYKLAQYNNLKGWVKNKGSFVEVDIEGKKKNIKNFLLKIVNEPPKQAKIEKIVVKPLVLKGYTVFEILKSSETSKCTKFISPDIATCEQCINDIFKKTLSNRFRYAFTNCTQCGPRYSIIKKLPYDRKNTTMKNFEMCESCQAEFENPTSRRFHTQPNCCKKCGPELILLDKEGKYIPVPDPVRETIKLIKMGKIIAIKGIGGYHLCCDATNKEVISLLRNKKIRPHKPLAVMVRDIETVKKICQVNSKEELVLKSFKRPITLLEKKNPFPLPDNIAPSLNKLGVILPYTPLHYLLLESELEYIIMTSGNISGKTIEYVNEKALKNLKNIVDYFLIHNREINIPIDDSVVRVFEDEEMVVRLGRGYVPFYYKFNATNDILALGGEQKNNISFLHNCYGTTSQYVGDLEDLDSYLVFQRIIQNFKDIFNFEPQIYVYDLHPDYLSSHYGNNQKGLKILVQHHHAHLASCIAEHDIEKPVIGVIYDGTGYGMDGNIWGGEFLVGTRINFKRVGHWQYVLLPRGNQTIKEPWRTAVSYLQSLGIRSSKFLKDVTSKNVNLVEQIIQKNAFCIFSSSMGRFFDCVAALLGLRLFITYDAQAAIELENIADKTISDYYQFQINENKEKIILSYENIILGVLEDVKNKVYPSVISAKFHNTVIEATVDSVSKISNKFGLNDVVLSGGVFENQYLLERLTKKLRIKGFNVYYNRKVPLNDGGISFGQLAIAEKRIREGIIKCV